MIRRIIGSLALWEFAALSLYDSVGHGVTSRHGGVSEAPYDQLNLGLHVGDEPERVIANRKRVAHALHLDFERVTFGQQVHGSAVHIVGAAEAGSGNARFEDGIAATDGLIVREPGIAVGVFVADCVPILLYDPEHHVAAAIHAGWRGTAAGIAGKAIEALAQQCGSRPEDLVVGIGPAIGRCCYEVSEEVACAVGVAEQRGGRWYADLVEANRRQLAAPGVEPVNIELSRMCTACHSAEFYSERQLGRPTGRFATVICLR